ncbi:hypothetical protein [Alteromonas phage XX1924]|nr:hypothetical protein [Alteromonas phage XX1924]
MSALRTALKPALTPALGSARRGVSRYFTTFDNVAQSFIRLDSNISLIGDFRVYSKFLWSDFSISGEQALLSALNQFDDFLMLNGAANANPNTVLYRNLPSSDVNFTGALPANSNFNEIAIERVGLSVSVTINGATTTLTESQLSVYEIRHIGARGGVTAFFNGIIANVKIIDNGTTALDMPINRYYTPQNNIVLDESGNGNNGTFVNIAAGRSKYYQQRADGNFVGLELITNGSFSELSSWEDESQGSGTSTISGGVAECTGDSFSNRGQLKQSINTRVGGVYEVGVLCQQDKGAFVIASNSSMVSLLVFSVPSAGYHTFRFTADGNVSNISLRSQAGTSLFDNVSVREILEVAY